MAINVGLYLIRAVVFGNLLLWNIWEMQHNPGLNNFFELIFLGIFTCEGHGICEWMKTIEDKECLVCRMCAMQISIGACHNCEWTLVWVELLSWVVAWSNMFGISHAWHMVDDSVWVRVAEYKLARQGWQNILHLMHEWLWGLLLCLNKMARLLHH